MDKMIKLYENIGPRLDKANEALDGLDLIDMIGVLGTAIDIWSSKNRLDPTQVSLMLNAMVHAVNEEEGPYNPEV